MISRDTGHECACVAGHRPSPLDLEEHHIWPIGMGGPDTPANRVWLCPNAHGNVHELLRLMVGAGRSLSDRDLQALEDRPVSRYAADLAREGYRRFVEGTAT